MNGLGGITYGQGDGGCHNGGNNRKEQSEAKLEAHLCIFGCWCLGFDEWERLELAGLDR